MVSTQLFSTFRGRRLPAADARNEAGGAAYRFTPRHALAQYAATGALNGTYYAGAEAQLDQVLALCEQVEPAFIAKTAIWCRRHGLMKDMPALLCAVLAVRDQEWLPTVFAEVIDNGRMLRNFVQILRSGALGRKSLGTRPKKLVQQWLNSADEGRLLAAAVGNQPSLADIVKMAHPNPTEAWRSAFFGWLIGKPYDVAALPPRTAAFERFKREGGEVPEVPFQMLTALELGTQEWTAIARNGGWQMVRMNLNTFARHGVFEQPGMVAFIAKRLQDAQAIKKARVFPYQLLTSYRAAEGVPKPIREALEKALEIALENVPRLPGRVVVCPDVSGSMQSPVTGYRKGATTATRCVDIAALVAAAFLRVNKGTRVLPFEQRVVDVKLDVRAGVLANAERLAAVGGGGTQCSEPLAWLNRRKEAADLVVMISDNESWVDSVHRGATATLQEWEQFRTRNPQARLVCVDIQPYATGQAPERPDILNIGGFGDEVFNMIGRFAAGEVNPAHWVAEIEQVTLARA